MYVCGVVILDVVGVWGAVLLSSFGHIINTIVEQSATCELLYDRLKWLAAYEYAHCLGGSTCTRFVCKRRTS